MRRWSTWFFAITITHLVISSILCLLCYVLWRDPGLNAAMIGCVLMLINLWLLASAWQRLIVKKVFALPISIIVIKYPLLMAFLREIIVTHQVNVGGLSVGLGSVVMTALVLAIARHFDMVPDLFISDTEMIGEPDTTAGKPDPHVDTDWVDHPERR